VGEPTPGEATAGQNPSRPPDWEKEVATLDGDGERDAVPAEVEEGGACQRGMLWVEREASSLASSQVMTLRGRERKGKD
jgi:hypothetical protein